MKFTLSNEKKKEMAEAALQSLEMHYYREVVLLGEDPETFVFPDESELNDPIKVARYANIVELSEKINNIQNVLNSLS